MQGWVGQVGAAPQVGSTAPQVGSKAEQPGSAQLGSQPQPGSTAWRWRKPASAGAANNRRAVRPPHSGKNNERDMGSVSKRRTGRTAGGEASGGLTADAVPSKPTLACGTPQSKNSREKPAEADGFSAESYCQTGFTRGCGLPADCLQGAALMPSFGESDRTSRPNHAARRQPQGGTERWPRILSGGAGPRSCRR